MYLYGVVLCIQNNDHFVQLLLLVTAADVYAAANIYLLSSQQLFTDVFILLTFNTQ